jgi:ribosomal protein S8
MNVLYTQVGLYNLYCKKHQTFVTLHCASNKIPPLFTFLLKQKLIIAYIYLNKRNAQYIRIYFKFNAQSRNLIQQINLCIGKQELGVSLKYLKSYFQQHGNTLAPLLVLTTPKGLLDGHTAWQLHTGGNLYGYINR